MPRKKRRKLSEESRKNMALGWIKRKQGSGYAAERKRLSESMKTRCQTPEHRKLFQLRMKNWFAAGNQHPMKGKKYPKGHFAGKGRRLAKGHKKSLALAWIKRKQGSGYAAERKRHSELMKIRSQNPEWKKYMADQQKKWYAAGNSSPMKGKRHSSEARRKMSLARKGKEPPNKGKPMAENSKRKVSRSLLKKYTDGYVNPNKGRVLTPAQIIALTHRVKKWYAAGNSSPMKGKRHSSEARRKMSLANSTPQARQTHREYRLHQVFPPKDTKIEKILQNELEKKEIRFTKHKQIIGQPDIFIEPNICIFADGDFWHGWDYLQGKDFSRFKKFNNEYFKSQIQNDARITMQLDKLGYIILRFWEHEINKDREKCLQKIIKIIKEARKQTSTKNS